MANALENLKKELRDAAGWAEKDGINCVKCREPYSYKNVRTPAEVSEVRITGLCGLCWEEIFSDEEK